MEEIEVRHFSIKECELKLIEYLLQHGNALKKMSVGPDLIPSVCDNILSFKMSSVDCNVVLSTSDDL